MDIYRIFVFKQHSGPPPIEYRPVARIFFGGVRSLERKGYFCQRFSVAVKSIYNQLRHDNSLLL